MSNQKVEINMRLCRNIELYPCIYDREHPDFKNKEICDKAWSEVAKECVDSVNSCKVRWRNIRYSYSRLLLRKGNSLNHYLHDVLKFYEPFVMPIGSGETISSQEPNDNEQQISEHDKTIADSGDSIETQEKESDKQNVTAKSSERNQRASKRATEQSVNNSIPKLCRLTNIESSNNSCTKPASEEHQNANTIENNKESAAAAVTAEKSSQCNILTVESAHVDFKNAFNGLWSEQLAQIPRMNERQRLNYKLKVYAALVDVMNDARDFPETGELPQATEKTAKTSEVEALINMCSNLIGEFTNLLHYLQSQTQSQMQLQSPSNNTVMCEISKHQHQHQQQQKQQTSMQNISQPSYLIRSSSAVGGTPLNMNNVDKPITLRIYPTGSFRNENVTNANSNVNSNQNNNNGNTILNGTILPHHTARRLSCAPFARVQQAGPVTNRRYTFCGDAVSTQQQLQTMTTSANLSQSQNPETIYTNCSSSNASPMNHNNNSNNNNSMSLLRNSHASHEQQSSTSNTPFKMPQMPKRKSASPTTNAQQIALAVNASTKNAATAGIIASDNFSVCDPKTRIF